MEYTTTDLYTVAVLVSQGYPIEEVRGDSRKKFVFKDNEQLRTCIRDFMNGALKGDLRNFKNAIETVKDLLHSS